jgi:acetate kinase
MNVLVLNSGSSSQKSCLYQIGDTLPDDPPAPSWEGKIEWVDGTAQSSIKNSRGVSRKEETSGGSRGKDIERLLRNLWSGATQAISGPSEINVVGHRVVHGGPQHFEPTMVTAEVRHAIEGVSVFAPLHNRAELEGVEIVAKLLGPVPQVAVFDTGFHRTMPLPAATYPGPYEWFEQGIRRYGFHGINHQYCAQRSAHLLGKNLNSLKLVTCHLGNGCSLAAIAGGRSLDTTMGFTPLEGVMMGTRSGSVDPGLLLHLLEQGLLTRAALDDALNHQSGLLGISGRSADMRQIQAARADGDTRATLAFDLYAARIRAAIGAMVAALGGLDALVFTAGVGEHSAEMRAAVADPLGWLGVTLDPAANAAAQPDTDIAAPDSRVRVLVIHTREELMVARETKRVLGP